MKRAYTVPVLAVVVLLASTIACGSSEPAQPIVEKAAADLNLAAADLGGDWSQILDQGLAEMPAMDQEHVRDANMRMFSSTELTGMVTSIVFSTEGVASAEQEMRADSVQNLGADMETQVPGLTLQSVDAPDVGDEAVMVGGNVSELGMNVYALAFRKANVIVMLSVLGMEDEVTQDLVVGYARKVEARIE